MKHVKIEGLVPRAFIDELESMVIPHRFAHSVGTAKMAVYLAGRYGVNKRKAAMAGLIHDCAKDLPRGLTLHYLKRAGKLDETTARIPALWHCIVGPYIARERFGIKDPEILEAIRSHTSGRAGMSKLAKIIYVSDFGEYNRENGPSMKIMRLIKNKNISLDELVRGVTRQKLTFLLENNLVIHEDGIRLWNKTV